MPTALTHAFAGVAVGALFAPGPMPLSYHGLTLVLGVLPDLDVISFSLGIPYHSRFGHRGFSHSLLCAIFIGLAGGLLGSLWWEFAWWVIAIPCAVAYGSHTALDALTDGGLGVAFFSPWTERRYFFPWRPIRVSPIGWGAFSRWGLEALFSEIFWVWVPLGVALLVLAFLR